MKYGSILNTWTKRITGVLFDLTRADSIQSSLLTKIWFTLFLEMLVKNLLLSLAQNLFLICAVPNWFTNDLILFFRDPVQIYLKWLLRPLLVTRARVLLRCLPVLNDVGAVLLVLVMLRVEVSLCVVSKIFVSLKKNNLLFENSCLHKMKF